MSTSFVQYKYCSLCRTSCKKWRKHVHSPRHQEIVKNILTKFLKKITDARSRIDQPLVKDGCWSEAARQVWCYSCTCDVDLHLPKTTVVGECVIVGAGFLGHLTRVDHGENTAKFLKDNLVDMKRTSEFLLDKDIFLKFLEKAEIVSVEYLNEKQKDLKKAASAMRLESALHRHVMNQGLLEQKRQQLSKRADSNAALVNKSAQYHFKNSKTDQEEGERKKTAQAFGDGLTVVERGNEDDSQGNIHSNAVPPWLMQDGTEDTKKDGFIGPSVSDWNKHKKLEQKRKLPACRVGAKFDHETKQGDEWLPNFGGVWSHGPRTKSSSHFKRRLDSTHQRHSKQDSRITHTHMPNTIPESNSHHIRESEVLSRLQQPAGSKQPLVNGTFKPPMTTNIQTPSSTSFVELDKSGGDYFTSPSPLTLTKKVKPYVSKRRKVGEADSSNSLQSPAFLESYNPTDGLSPHISKHYHPPVSNFIAGQQVPRTFTNQNNDASANKSNQSLRLLHTPVLSKKS